MRRSCERPGLSRWVGAVLALSCAGCRSEDSERGLERMERLGILDELVLFDRPEASGGPFFLDRFEATVGEWNNFVTRKGVAWADGSAWNASEAENIAVTGVSLVGARRFARDRLGRLPTLAEWRFAAGAGDRFRFPWGDRARPFKFEAATADLGIRAPVAVGTFVSGIARGVGGRAVYDLIGNAAEWTETVRDGPRQGIRDVLDPERRARRAQRLAPYHWPQSESLLLSLAAERVPRAVVPGLERSLQRSGVNGVVEWARPKERSSLRGLRVASDPRTLLVRLAELSGAPSDEERAALDQFVRRPRVLELLRDADRREPALLDQGQEIARYLRGALRR